MKFIILVLLGAFISCQKKYSFQVPALNLTQEQLIEKIVLIQENKSASLKGAVLNNGKNIYQDYRQFLKDKNFSISDLELIHYMAQEDIAAKLFARVTLEMQMNSASILEFVASKGLEEMDQERFRILKEIGESSGYTPNIAKTVQRFDSFMQRLPLNSSERSKIVEKQKTALEASVYYAHRDTSLEELQKIHYLLTSSAYRKNLEFWANFQENQLDKTFDQLDKILPQESNPNK